MDYQIRCLDVGAVQSGNYSQTGIRDVIWDVDITGMSRTTATSWGGKLFPKQEGEYNWTIKAFAEGYPHKTVTMKIKPREDSRVKEAFADAQPDAEGRLGQDIKATGYRPVLIALQPGSGQPQQGNDERRAAAQREYNEALEAYNAAISKLNAAKGLSDASGIVSPSAMAGSDPIAKLGGLLSTLGSAENVRSAEREVEIARQRLERAKSRIDAADWR
jgi:hypothetical protein